MASSDSRALLDEQVGQLKELIASVQEAAGAAAEILQTDPADPRKLAQRLARYVFGPSKRLNNAIDSANLLVPIQSTVQLSSAHGPVPAFSAFVEMNRTMWLTFEGASKCRKADPTKFDEIVEMLLHHWTATTVPRLENCHSVFDLWAAATVVNRDIRERYNQLISQFHQASGCAAVPTMVTPIDSNIETAILPHSIENALELQLKSETALPTPATSQTLAKEPVQSPGSTSLTVFESQCFCLTQLLSAAQGATDHIVDIMMVDCENLVGLAESVAACVVFTLQDLAKALREANVLVSQNCKVKISASATPIFAIGALRALAMQVEAIARKSAPDLEFIPENRAAISAALQNSWKENGVPNFGSPDDIADTRAIGTVVCEHVRTCHQELSDRFHLVHLGASPLLPNSAITPPSISSDLASSESDVKNVVTLSAGATPIGFLGGEQLADALGVHSSQREAFAQQLGRKRKNLPAECWIEVADPRPNCARFLYLVSALTELAAAYRNPKQA